MKYFKVSLYSDKSLSLSQKKKYIDKMYRDNSNYYSEKINQGVINKFNNSIGFKPVIDYVNGFSVVTSAKVESPECYKAPESFLFENMQSPVDSSDILVFYLPKLKMNHPDERFSYHTRTISEKWKAFLMKVFPELNVSIEEVDEISKKSLQDFALEFFYRNIHETDNVTIEFSGSKKLTEEELKYILSKLQCLSKNKITIAQYECETCKEYSDGKNPYHIEIVYLNYFKDNDEEEIYSEYGDRIYKVS